MQYVDHLQALFLLFITEDKCYRDRGIHYCVEVSSSWYELQPRNVKVTAMYMYDYIVHHIYYILLYKHMRDI